MDDHPDLYDILHIKSNSSLTEIKNAFICLAKELHPDKQVGTSRVTDNNQFLQVQSAWETLRDPITRSIYDSFLMSKSRTPVISADVDLDEMIEIHRCSLGEALPKDKTQFDLCSESENKKAWEFPCRCSGSFQVTETALAHGLDLVPCSSCSLHIRVHFEEEEEEEEEEGES